MDVNGNVSGMASQGPGADFCEHEVLTPMPYARVNIGVTQAFADENGDFVVPNGGTSSVTVQSPVRGQRFVVSNAAGANTILSMSVTPPGPADFTHNAANSSELIRAEVNAYVEANTVRDWIVAANPSYPQIGSQTNFSIVVNRTDGFFAPSFFERRDRKPHDLDLVDCYIAFAVVATSVFTPLMGCADAMSDALKDLELRPLAHAGQPIPRPDERQDTRSRPRKCRNRDLFSMRSRRRRRAGEDL